MINTIAVKRIASVLSVSAAKVKTVWEPLKRIFFFSPADNVIAPAKNVSVSIERGSLAVASGSRLLSRVRIKGFRRYPLEGYPTPEGLASSVVLALSQLGASKKDITLGIPKSWAVIKIAEFPPAVKDAIQNVVSYELDRLTPFSAEDALYDFKILSENGEKLVLLVAAVKADMVTPYIDSLREKGCSVTKVTTNLTGIGTLCSFLNKSADSLFVKINESEYEGAAFSGGMMTGAFTGILGAGDEESGVDAVIKGMEPLLEKAKEQGKSSHVIAALKSGSPTFREMLKQRVGAHFKILDETDISLGLRRTKEIPYEAVGVVLESLWPRAKGLNLLKRGYEEKAKTPVALSIVLVAAIVTLWVLSILAPVRTEEERLREMQRQVSMRMEEVKKVEALKKEIGALDEEILTITNFKEGRPMALNIVKELTEILPKTAWLSRVRITETGVEIEGYASSATELLPKLETSKYFKKAEFGSPTFRDARLNAERFNIRMEIERVMKVTEEKEKPKVEKK